jgi:hypothetical protein
MGFNNVAVKWVSSYLQERKQMVNVDETLSKTQILNWGKSQGSVLGPLFFLLNINYRKSACTCDLFLYADDSPLLVSHKDKMSILFGSKVKLRKSPDFKVVVDDLVLTVKYC